MGNYMNKADVFATRKKCPQDTVDTPSGKIKVRGLTCGEYGEYQDSCNEDGQFKLEFSRARLMMYGCINESGTQMFVSEDMGRLVEIPGAIGIPASEKILELTGITSGRKIAKNSATPTSSGSDSGSPVISEEQSPS